MMDGDALPPTAADARRSSLLHYLQSRLGLAPDQLHEQQRLDAIGLDSLEVPGLLEHLRANAGIELEIGDVLEARTVGDVLERLTARESGPLQDTDYARYVNPALARLLRHLHLDRRYVRGEGLCLHDAQGREVLDFTAQFGALPFGFNPPEIWRALDHCRERGLPSFVQPSLLGPAARLAAALVRRAPRGLERVVFANSGAEAVEIAIKLAFARTGRRGIVSTQGGFHGKTLGALSATGRDTYRAAFGLPLPGFRSVAYDDPVALEALLAAEPEAYAAFIVEPIQGEAGVIVPAEDYLSRVRAICRRYGVLLAVDEVQTGLGRTGTLFATPSELEPDLLMLAKGLGGGLLPAAACLCRADVHTHEFALKHSSTFAGGSLAAEAGMAVLELLEDPARDVLGHVQRTAARLRVALEGAAQRHPRVVAAVRGRGLMLGMELRMPREDDSDCLLAIAAEQEQLAALFASYLLNVHNVRAAHSLHHGNVLRVQPALTVSDAECTRFVAAVEAGLAAFESGSIARVYAPICGASPLSAARRTPRRRALLPRASELPRFAMLYHPPEPDSYAQLDASVAELPASLRESFARDAGEIMAPFVAARSCLVSSTGARAEGVFVVAPHTAAGLTQLTAAARARLFDQCFEIARRYGARVLGFGGYTSIISRGGLDLVGRGVVVTSGNGLTAVACARSLAGACREQGRSWSQLSVAVLGGGGSIGRATALLCARDAGAIHCVGNSSTGDAARERLERVADELCGQLLLWAEDETIAGGALLARVRELRRRWPAAGDCRRWLRERLDEESLVTISLELGALARAQGVIAAISTPRPVVTAQHLQRGAILCDASRPRALAAAVGAERPDLRVIEAGRVALPYRAEIAPIGLPKGQLHACMAETLLLTWQGATRDYSLGRDLALSDVLELERWAGEHGLAFVHEPEPERRS